MNTLITHHIILYLHRFIHCEATMAGGGENPILYQPKLASSFRSSAQAPLRKLTVDLIKTYRKINEVIWVDMCVCVLSMIVDVYSVCVSVYMLNMYVFILLPTQTTGNKL